MTNHKKEMLRTIILVTIFSLILTFPSTLKENKRMDSKEIVNYTFEVNKEDIKNGVTFEELVKVEVEKGLTLEELIIPRTFKDKYSPIYETVLIAIIFNVFLDSHAITKKRKDFV